MIRYSITYGVITAESAQTGEWADNGYEEEWREGRLYDAFTNALNNYSIGSNLPHDLTEWWSSVDPECNKLNGSEKCFSLHIATQDKQGKWRRLTHREFDRLNKAFAHFERN